MPQDKRSLADLLDERFCYKCNSRLNGQPCYDYKVYHIVTHTNSITTSPTISTLDNWYTDELICEKCQWNRVK